MSDSLTSRVAQLLRGERHLPRTLSEREATIALRPYGQGVQRTPVLCPLTDDAPELLRTDGARGEQAFGSDVEFTP